MRWSMSMFTDEIRAEFVAIKSELIRASRQREVLAVAERLSTLRDRLIEASAALDRTDCLDGEKVTRVNA
jgi:hypothetical protein